MKMRLTAAAVAIAIAATLLPDGANAQAGRMHRATRRRTAVVVGSTVEASDQAAASQQQAATTAKPAPAPTAAPAAPPPAVAAQPTAPAAAAGAALAVGTVVPALPTSGCAATAVSGVEYYHCGSDYYRAVFQGNSLVYVTAAPPS